MYPKCIQMYSEIFYISRRLKLYASNCAKTKIDEKDEDNKKRKKIKFLVARLATLALKKSF